MGWMTWYFGLFWIEIQIIWLILFKKASKDVWSKMLSYFAKTSAVEKASRFLQEQTGHQNQTGGT